MSAPRNVAILIFDDVELLDFCGPLEVFSVAGRFIEPPGWKVFTVAQSAGVVVTHDGLSVVPHHAVVDCPKPDILLVPGGQGTRHQMHNEALIEWIKETSRDAELVLSVCTGALLLAKAGLLEGLEATTHHGGLELLKSIASDTKIRDDVRFVDNGKIITSAGIAAGIDMAFHVVVRLFGKECAQRTARQMEYP